MTKHILFITAFIFAASFLMNVFDANAADRGAIYKSAKIILPADTTVPADVMEVVKAVIYSTNKFNIEAVANLYTPNAVIADDEPPYSWNGPTAGIQWVYSVEKACKEYQLSKFKATAKPVNVYQQNADNAYIVVPVSYTADLPGGSRFNVSGAFTFVLRMINGKWLIKSQVWMPKKGMN